MREQRVAVGGGGAAAVDLIRDQLLRVRLSLVGRFLVAIDEDHVDTGLCADIGDASAHEAGSEHADLFDRLGRYGRRTACALVKLLHGNEQ